MTRKVAILFLAIFILLLLPQVALAYGSGDACSTSATAEDVWSGTIRVYGGAMGADGGNPSDNSGGGIKVEASASSAGPASDTDSTSGVGGNKVETTDGSQIVTNGAYIGNASASYNPGTSTASCDSDLEARDVRIVPFESIPFSYLVQALVSRSESHAQYILGIGGSSSSSSAVDGVSLYGGIIVFSHAEGSVQVSPGSASAAAQISGLQIRDPNSGSYINFGDFNSTMWQTDQAGMNTLLAQINGLLSSYGLRAVQMVTATASIQGDYASGMTVAMETRYGAYPNSWSVLYVCSHWAWTNTTTKKSHAEGDAFTFSEDYFPPAPGEGSGTLPVTGQETSQLYFIALFLIAAGLCFVRLEVSDLLRA